MNVLHPISAMTVARLAAKLIDDISWIDSNKVEARDIIARMEKGAAAGPAENSPAARVLAAHAKRLSALASQAYEDDNLYVEGRDLSWLWDPAQMDAIHRSTFSY